MLTPETVATFLPGAAGLGGFWSPVVERLPPAWRTQLVDLPGYELTGPPLLTFPEAVDEMARAAGRAIRYVQVSPAEGVAAMNSTNVFALAPVFMTALFGIAAACLPLAVTARSARRKASVRAICSFTVSHDPVGPPRAARNDDQPVK